MSSTSIARSRRKRLVVPASLTALAVGGVGVLASGAVFTDTTTVNANAFSAGTVDLSTDPTATAITMVNMAPGDVVTKPLVVKNTGSLALRYAMESVATGTLAPALTLQVKTGVTDCSTSGFAATGTSLYGAGAIGSATGMKVFGDKTQGPDLGDRTLGASAQETLCVQVALPGDTTGNDYQNQTASASFNFYADQVANSSLVIAPPAGASQTLLHAALNSAGNAVTVNWPASTDSHVTGYVLSRTSDNGTTWQTIATPASPATTTYTDTTVAQGVTYGYAIQAVGFDGTLSPLPTTPATNAKVAVPYQAPAAPASVTDTVSGTSVNLTWPKSTSAWTTGYTVLRSADNGATWTTLATTDTSTTTYTDATAPTGTVLYAVTALGQGSTQSTQTLSAPIVTKPAAGTVTALTTTFNNGGVFGITYVPSNDSLYVAVDQHNFEMAKVASVGGSPTYISDTGNYGLGNVFDSAYDPTNGYLYGASLTDGSIYQIAPSTNYAEPFAYISSVGQAGIRGIAYDSANGYLYASTYGGTVYKVDPYSGTSTILTTAAPGGFGITFDPADGNLYVHGTGNLYKVNPTTGAVTTLTTGIGNEGRVTFDPTNGSLYATANDTGKVYKVNPSTGSTTVIATINGVYGITYDPANDSLYVTAPSNANILQKVAP